MLASTFRRPRCDMPSTAESSPISAASARIASRIGISDSAPSSPKRFWPRYFVARNLSSASAALSLPRMCCWSSTDILRRRTFDLLLDPALLLGLLDVHVLDADRPAVGVAQHVQDLAERQLPLPADRCVDPHVAAGQELAVEVPDGQPVGGRVELGVHLRRFRRQRVQVGDQVAADPVHVDQRGHLHLLDDLRRLVVGRVGVLSPQHRLVGHTDRPEDALVEVVARPSAAHGPSSAASRTRRPG